MIRRLLLFLFLFWTASAKAETFYISASGGVFVGGTACNGQSTQTNSFFNTAGNWANPKVGGKIGPGDTVYVCGTFTGGVGQRAFFTFQASGNAGNLITLKFDSNALLQAQAFSSNTGAINVNSQSYYIISGYNPTACGWNPATHSVTNCQGTIQNTDNGDGANCPNGVSPPTCSNHSNTLFINLTNSPYGRVTGLNLWNAYARSSPSDSPQTGGLNTGEVVLLTYGGGNSHDIQIDRNVILKCAWCIQGGNDNLEIGPYNDVEGYSHGVQSAAAHLYVHDSHWQDTAPWDWSAYHADLVHCYGAAGTGPVSAFYFYNNQIDGSAAVSTTAVTFTQGADCMAPNGTQYVFNNINIMPSGVNFTPFQVNGNVMNGSDNGDIIANNLLIGPRDSVSQTAGQLYIQASLLATIVNNAVTHSTHFNDDSSPRTTVLYDYNAYADCTDASGCWHAFGVNSSSFAVWKAASCTGSPNTCDQHGLANTGSTTYFNLPSGCISGSTKQNCAPQAGSPLIAAGKNLYSVCNGQPNPGLGALCFDISGVPRPSSAAWDVGAYQFSSSSTQVPAAPTGLSATVN